MAQRSMAHVNARSAVTLVSLVERFGHSEDACRSYVQHLRWPNGVRCVECDSDKVSTIQAVTKYRRDTKDGHKAGDVREVKTLFECSRCTHQFSVTAGTVFHDTHLPLWKWFLATYLMVDARKGVSANQLRRELGVTYKTAWYLCHRIRSAMETLWTPLEGTVEIDETYLGGKKRGIRQGYRENKAMVMGALQRGGEVRLRFVKGETYLDGYTARRFFSETVDEDAEHIYTDDHKVYNAVRDDRRQSVNHNQEEWVRGDVSTNGIESAWSLLKRSIVGSYHQLSAKHLAAYLDEFEFRFNNRANPYLFRDTLLALIRSERLTYADLIEP